ncbi:MAG: hypothetical protein GF344_14020 [Chitinivibrionales bacterium]|nr:hypothetical protein [Chitinivibrionales bacterium]MBD3357842.1 hypothetical protein [Chitinivibrionales bacterium]
MGRFDDAKQCWEQLFRVSPAKSVASLLETSRDLAKKAGNHYASSQIEAIEK